jgi:hypothetical protein
MMWLAIRILLGLLVRALGEGRVSGTFLEGVCDVYGWGGDVGGMGWDGW